MLILATLLLFCAVLLIVPVGTLYPMIYSLLGWGRLSVGAPYFNRATLPFALLMLVVIVLATFVSGKRAQLRRCWRMRACCYLPRDCGFQRQPSGDQPEFTAGSAGDAGRIHLPF